VKVVHLSTQDSKGGGPRAAYRLHVGLRQLGCDSSMIVARRRSGDPAVMALPGDLLGPVRRRLRWRQLPLAFFRYWRSRPVGYTLFTDHRARHGARLVSQLPSCDVVNLHWVAQFIDYRTFFTTVPSRTPVVWTLHDVNAFSGGCHINLGCKRYVEDCGACPQLGSRNLNDVSHKIWQHKREIYNQIEPGRLHIVTPSRWMATQVQHSSLMSSFPVSVIPNGLDTDVFSPQDRCMARSTLGIPQDMNVILFVANSVIIRHKGFSLLAQALSNLDGSVFLVSLGSGRPVIDASIPHLHLRHIENDRQLALFYSAADVFVIPSLQENLPNTVMEALACGTSVVGFAVGGIPDMVRPGVTGSLVPPEDVRSLRTAIVELLQDTDKRARMALNCRRIAVEEYALKVQAQRYSELYREITERTKDCLTLK